MIFAKNLELGKVKTRLAATLGDEAALAVYTDLCLLTKQVTAAASCDKQVYYSGFDPGNDLWNGEGFEKRVQQGTDLGVRLIHAFENALKKAMKKSWSLGVIVESWKQSI